MFLQHVHTTCSYAFMFQILIYFSNIFISLLKAILSENSTSGLVILKHNYSYRQKVVHAVIRSVGMFVKVHALVKNMMGM